MKDVPRKRKFVKQDSPSLDSIQQRMRDCADRIRVIAVKMGGEPNTRAGEPIETVSVRYYEATMRALKTLESFSQECVNGYHDVVAERGRYKAGDGEKKVSD